MIERRSGRLPALVPFALAPASFAALWLLAGCAATSDPASLPEEPAVASTQSSPLPEQAGFLRDVEKMIAAGEVDRAAAALQAERERGSGAASAGEQRFAEGEIARARAKLDAALVAYAGVENAPGGASLAGVSWERIAAVHGTRKETEEELRALLMARDRLEPRSQGSVNARIAAILGGLTPEKRAAWVRAYPGAALGAKGAAPAKAPNPKTLRVGLLAPLTGRFAHFGEAFRLGAELALARRSSGSSPVVELKVKDAPSDPLATQSSARAAILEDGCVAILGPILSMPIVAAGSLAESHRVPLLAPAVTESRLSSLGSAVFSLDPSAQELARELARTSIETLDLQTFVIVTSDDARSAERAAEFEREAKERGGKIVAKVPYEVGKKDYRAVLAEAKKTPSDAVYILGEASDLEIFAKQMDGVRLGRTVLGHGEWADDRVRGLAASSLEGAVLVMEEGECPASEFSRSLEDGVRKSSGGDLSRFHTYGYEAMAEVLAAIDQGAREPDALIEVLRAREAWPSPPPGRRVGAWKREGGQLRPLAQP